MDNDQPKNIIKTFLLQADLKGDKIEDILKLLMDYLNQNKLMLMNSKINFEETISDLSEKEDKKNSNTETNNNLLIVDTNYAKQNEEILNKYKENIQYLSIENN